jgi:hypothetical protein
VKPLARSIVGGVIGGAVGALELVASKLAGLPIFGPMSLAGYVGLALVLGVVFGLAAHGFCRIGVLVWGLVFGALVWFTTYFVVVPLLRATNVLPDALGMSAFAYLSFGLAMGAGFLPFRDERQSASLLKTPHRSVDAGPLPDLFDPV